MEEKEGFWGKVKKKLTKKAIITILCIVLTVCICAGLYHAAQAIVDSMINQVTTAASNAFQLLFGDEDDKEVELYNIDTSVGVDGCKLRPKTGVYPGTSGSSGSGTSNGSFPSGVKTIQQLLDEEKAAGLITDSTKGVSDRGKTKSMMGWQTLGGLSHSSHTSSSAVINYGKSGALQHRFVISLKQGTKDINADIPKTITKGEITWFDELGFGKVEGRYTVAIKQDLGTYIWGKQTQIGDYIDVYLDSGTVINCVVADVKARENKSNIVHQDGSIVEFVTNVHKFYGCCNGTGKHVAPVSVKPEFNQPILGIVKVGSYWTNPECQEGAINGGTTTTTPTTPTTQEEVTTLPDGTEIPPGYAFLDSNGQPCTPDGSSTNGPTTAVTAVPGRRTLTNLFATARLPLGISVYDQTNMTGAQHIGVRDAWKVMFDACKAKDIAWNWKTMTNSTVGVSGEAQTNYVLDCSKYMAWLWYNVTHTDASESILKSYGATTGGIVSLYTSNGFKKVGVYGSGVSESDLKPGDVLNKHTSGTQHVIMVVGRAKDGGIVIIHSSPNGVKLGGVGTNAGKVAESYMQTYVPEFPSNKVKSSGFNAKAVSLGSGYINGYTVLRQDGLLEDPDGIYSMNAEQILDIMFGVNALGGALPGGNGSTGKKVFIDPGHGPSNFNDAQMAAAGYSKNSSGKWGEWRHYDGSGKVGTNCNNCKKDASHNCWYPFANALRDKEPELTYAIATELSTILQSRGYEVAMSRNASEHPSIGKRAKDAHDFGASIQVCIHCNAGGGSGIAYCSPAGGGYGTNSYKLSDWQTKSLDLNKKILNGIKAKTTFSLYNSGVINNYGYLILYEKASCPTAYLEIGFYDNASDLSKLQNEKNKIAEGIADGIDAYFK